MCVQCHEWCATEATDWLCSVCYRNRRKTADPGVKAESTSKPREPDSTLPGANETTASETVTCVDSSVVTKPTIAAERPTPDVAKSTPDVAKSAPGVANTTPGVANTRNQVSSVEAEAEDDSTKVVTLAITLTNVTVVNAITITNNKITNILTVANFITFIRIGVCSASSFLE